MAPTLNHPSSTKHINNIRISRRRKPMRNSQDPTGRVTPTSAHPPLHKPLVDKPLALAIERTCRLVEEQDGGVAEQRARDSEALSLAA